MTMYDLGYMPQAAADEHFVNMLIIYAMIIRNPPKHSIFGGGPSRRISIFSDHFTRVIKTTNP